MNSMKQTRYWMALLVVGLLSLMGSAIGQQTTTNSDLTQFQQAKKGLVKPAFGFNPDSGLREGEMRLGEESIIVELALDGAAQAQGLMFRESMPSDRGMLFMFPQTSELSFWMKNTLIPLDIIYISDVGEIVHIVTAQPCKISQCPSYPSVAPAKYVLELNAGEAKARGLKAGMNLAWEW